MYLFYFGFESKHRLRPWFWFFMIFFSSLDRLDTLNFYLQNVRNGKVIRWVLGLLSFHKQNYTLLAFLCAPWEVFGLSVPFWLSPRTVKVTKYFFVLSNLSAGRAITCFSSPCVTSTWIISNRNWSMVYRIIIDGLPSYGPFLDSLSSEEDSLFLGRFHLLQL